MSAELITIHIFVMGLAMLDTSQDGKSLAILMPPDCEHYPVLLYPCANGSPRCTGGVAYPVSGELNIRDDNYQAGFLVPNPQVNPPQSFGAYDLKNSSVGLDKPHGDLQASAKRQGRHHWWSGWWFHMRGELPTKADAADLFWLPSLSEFSNCNVEIPPPENAPNLLNQGSVTSYLALKPGEWTSVRTVSVGGIREDEAAVCTEIGTVSRYAIASEFAQEFSPWYQTFSRSHQAAADIIEIDTAIEKDSGITIVTLTPNGATSVTIYPDFGISPDLLIGNLAALPNHIPPVCDVSGLAHFKAFYQLLPTCRPVVPRFGRMKARIKKTDLAQDCSHLPAVTGAVSGKCVVETGGQARPICYIPTN